MNFQETIFSPDHLASLLSLTLMEIVLGIDNIVFISIVVGRLPEQNRFRARSLGLFLALFIRIALLFTITWFTQMTQPLFLLSDLGLASTHAVGLRDIILFVGGIFLLYSATSEIYEKVEGADEGPFQQPRLASFGLVLLQVVALDIVFSVDSILTAVGLSNELYIMISAVVISLGVMLAFSGKIAGFIERYPSVKILALAFLLMIGLLLIGEAAHYHIPKGYVYSAMAFSLTVEIINIRYRRKKYSPAKQASENVPDKG